MIDIIPDNVHSKMFRLRWSNGDTSADVYNQTTAIELKRRCDQRVKDKEPFEYGELTEFSDLHGEQRRLDGRMCIFHGHTYAGTPWTRKRLQPPENGAATVLKHAI